MNTFRLAFLDGYLCKTASPLDDRAHAAATSPHNDLREPTVPQRKAGNYQKGHLRYQGLDISIENPAGSTRSGVSKDGKKWSNTLQHHYGYIRGTTGFDKDHVDVFLNPDAGQAYMVWVVNQIDPQTGEFDEHKCMLGFTCKDDARAAYFANYQKGWRGMDSIVSMPLDKFKAWVYSKGPKRGALETAQKT